MRKHVLVVVIAAMGFASGVDASSSPPLDQQLADALVVRKADGPSYWLIWEPNGGALFGCALSAPGATASSRSAVGGPNTGIDSLATVFPDRRRARLYFRQAVTTVSRCMQNWIADAHPNHVWDARPLSLGRYGRQSTAWRLRFIDDSRKSLDWALVDTGRAVLVDVFSIAWYDAGWHDVGVAGAPAVVVERRVLKDAIHRAATVIASAGKSSPRGQAW